VNAKSKAPFETLEIGDDVRIHGETQIIDDRRYWRCERFGLGQAKAGCGRRIVGDNSEVSAYTFLPCGDCSLERLLTPF
jgi:hypothetical protein